MHCESVAGMAVQLVSTGGSGKLQGAMLQGVTLQFATTGGSVVLQGETQEEEAVSVLLTGGSGELQCEGRLKALQCCLWPTRVQMQCETMDAMALQLVAPGGSAELPCEMLEGVTVNCLSTGGSGDLQLKMLEGVAVQFPTSGGSGELQSETLVEEAVCVPVTGGSGQLLCAVFLKALQCCLWTLGELLRCSVSHGWCGYHHWRCLERCWKECQEYILPLEAAESYNLRCCKRGSLFTYHRSSGELQSETLEEEAMMILATGGNGELQWEGCWNA